MAACDMILLAQPVSGHQYDLSSFGAMEYVDSFRAAIGSMGGLVCSFFICFGYWYLKTVFEGVSPKRAMWLFVVLSSSMFFGGAFHAAYYFISVPGLGLGQNPISPVILTDFRTHLEMLSYLGVPGFAAGSILFFQLAADGRFPTWFKYCNPLVLSLLFLALFYFLPAPVGGYIRPTFINMATSAMFIISFWVSARQKPL